MTNWYITDDYKLKKMYGYKALYNFQNKIQGLYVCTFDDALELLIASGGHLYKITEVQLNDEENWNTIVPTDLGTISDQLVTFFAFDKKIYLLDGEEYRVYDGTSLKIVDGYIPKIIVSATPAGDGTDYEAINLLTGKKHMTFNGNGTDKVFHMPEKNLVSVDKVIVNTVEMTDQYTIDLIEGTVTFNEAPSEAMDNVDIYWTTNNNDRHFISNMHAGIVFGGDTDTRVFMYGNKDEPNRIRYSSVANLVPSVEYFPGVNQLDAGTSNFDVTDLRRQYDRLIVTTNKPDAYYITLSTIDIEGVTTLSPQTLPLNEVHGNVAFAQGQVINNDPITIENNAIIRWTSTNVRDERNMTDISERIKLDLSGFNLKNAITCDYQSHTQLWIAVNNTVYIYNYYNDTFSRIVFNHEPSAFVIIDNRIYMGTEDGYLMKLGEEYQDYAGSPIKAHWEMDFYDFGVPYLRKTMNRLWVLMQPQAKSSAEIGYITNRNELAIKKRIEYSLVLLDDVDFADFSFQVSQNPQPFRLKMKAKKFTNLKITIDNNDDTDATILSLSLKVETGGESK